MYRTASLVFGGGLNLIGLIVLLVALTTNWWLVIRVDGDQLNVASDAYKLAYLNRNRGVFVECFSDTKKAKPLLESNTLATDDLDCIKVQFTSGMTDIVFADKYNKMRSDLMLAEAVFLCIAVFLSIVGFGVFCYGLVYNNEHTRSKWSVAVRWAGILIFLTALCNALGMAFFHSAEYLETQKVTTNKNEVPFTYYFKQAQPTLLQGATYRYYGWSYICGWIAVSLHVVAALIMFLSGACCGGDKSDEKMMYEPSTLQSARSMGNRNRAYDYSEGNLPTVYYSAPPMSMIEDGYHDHFRGRHFNPQRAAPQQFQIAPQYNYEQGGWTWQ